MLNHLIAPANWTSDIKQRKFLMGVLADYLAELKRSYNKLYTLQEGVKYFNIDFKMNINDGKTLL